MPLRIFALFAVPAALIFVIFVVAGFVWWPFWLLTIPATAAVVWAYWRRADDAVIRSLSARPLGATEGQRLRNTVENLCLTSGIEQPEVLVIDDRAVNVATINGRRNTLVVTTALLDTLDIMETEGVVAHALSKYASGDTQYTTLAASGGAFVTKPQRSWARQWDGGDAGVVRFDISGVKLTRYPPGLRSALEKIDALPTEVDGGDSLGTAWLVPPPDARLPIDHRIEVLQEL